MLIIYEFLEKGWLRFGAKLFNNIHGVGGAAPNLSKNEEALAVIKLFNSQSKANQKIALENPNYFKTFRKMVGRLLSNSKKEIQIKNTDGSLTTEIRNKFYNNNGVFDVTKLDSFDLANFKNMENKFSGQINGYNNLQPHEKYDALLKKLGENDGKYRPIYSDGYGNKIVFSSKSGDRSPIKVFTNKLNAEKAKIKANQPEPTPDPTPADEIPKDKKELRTLADTLAVSLGGAGILTGAGAFDKEVPIENTLQEGLFDNIVSLVSKPVKKYLRKKLTPSISDDVAEKLTQSFPKTTDKKTINKILYKNDIDPTEGSTLYKKLDNIETNIKEIETRIDKRAKELKEKAKKDMDDLISKNDDRINTFNTGRQNNKKISTEDLKKYLINDNKLSDPKKANVKEFLDQNGDVSGINKIKKRYDNADKVAYAEELGYQKNVRNLAAAGTVGGGLLTYYGLK